MNLYDEELMLWLERHFDETELTLDALAREFGVTLFALQGYLDNVYFAPKKGRGVAVHAEYALVQVRIKAYRDHLENDYGVLSDPLIF